MKELLIIIAFFLLAACDGGNTDKLNKNLPWQVNRNADGSTKVLGVDIGNVTFKDLMFKLKLLAEPAVFEDPEGKLTLEAYFGKKKFGALEARLVAELEAEQALLQSMKKNNTGRESTPSNHWKYSLDIKETKIANDLRVWRLIYLPVSDYEPKQMNFFGKPESVQKISETAEYRYYPSKGMVLLYDTEGKEIFYYAAQKDFERLKAALPKEVVMSIR